MIEALCSAHEMARQGCRRINLIIGKWEGHRPLLKGILYLRDHFIRINQICVTLDSFLILQWNKSIYNHAYFTNNTILSSIWFLRSPVYKASSMPSHVQKLLKPGHNFSGSQIPNMWTTMPIPANLWILYIKFKEHIFLSRLCRSIFVIFY